jgi:hypothetical protein
MLQISQSVRPRALGAVRYVPVPFQPRHLGALSAEAQAGQGDVATRLKEILEQQKRDARFRTIAFIIGVGGAVFAAVRLGIIAFPIVRERVAARRARFVPTPTVAPALAPAPALSRRRRLPRTGVEEPTQPR